MNNSCVYSIPPFTHSLGLCFEELFPHILYHSTTKRYHSACKIFWIYSFCFILYGIFTITMNISTLSLSHVHCDSRHSQHTHTLEKLLWIQLFWMKKMKFYCIEHTKLWSEIKCMYLCAVAKYARWIYEFASANICTVPMFAKYKSDGRHWCFYIQLAQILCEIQLIHN